MLEQQRIIEARRIAIHFAKKIDITLGQTPDDAFDRCWELSLAFSSFARGMGEKANMVSLSFCARPWQNTDLLRRRNVVNPELQGHYVVQLPKYRLFVDWTARQFWPHEDHPWIFDIKTLKKTWGAIEGGLVGYGKRR